MLKRVNESGTIVASTEYPAQIVIYDRFMDDTYEFTVNSEEEYKDWFNTNYNENSLRFISIHRNGELVFKGGLYDA